MEKYSYDGLNRRIEELTGFGSGTTATSVTHYYLDSSDQVVETRVGSPATSPESLAAQYQYVWSQRYIDAPVLRDTYATAGGVTAVNLSARVYYTEDANCNVTALVSAAGTVVERLRLHGLRPGHRLQLSWVNLGSTSTVGNTRLFAGMDFDPNTGLCYDRARYYSPALERFVGIDPIYYDNGANRYEYVGDDPGYYVDPTGLTRHHWFMAYWSDRSGQDKVNKVCQIPHIDIHRYTTEYSKEEHGFITNSWVHGELSFPIYQTMYEGLLMSSKTCCQFLIGMKGLMLAWHSAIRLAQSRGSLPGKVNLFDLIHKEPKISGDPPASNYAEFNQKVAQACGCSDKQKENTNRRILDKRMEFLQNSKET